MSNKTYSVSYEGWVVVEAKDEKEAHFKAGTMLADGSVVNDGTKGEWYIGEIELEEEEEDE